MPNGDIHGGELYQQRAKASLPVLVRQAMARQPIYYSDLADEVKMPNPRNLNHVLDCVGEALERLGEEWGTDIPPLQCLVLNKTTKIPSEGVFWFYEDRQAFEKMPLRQKREIVGKELEVIYAYNQWPRVLQAFGMKPLVPDPSDAVKKASTFSSSRESTGSSFGSGGESPQHRKLKNFIAGHPKLLGLPSSLKSQTERPLPSGDVLDVFFRHGRDWIGVEVKSLISDIGDITRGLFQCVKYKAVLEAEQARNSLPQSARAILVLEGTLPEELTSLRGILNVDVIQEVGAIRI